MKRQTIAGGAGGAFSMKEQTKPENGLAATNSANPLSEREHRSMVIDYNNTAAPSPAAKTIVELFEAQVARSPDAEAIRLGNQTLSYRQLNERANQLAAHLRILDVG